MTAKTRLERTPEAARQCGFSSQTLMRYREYQGGFFVSGICAGGAYAAINFPLKTTNQENLVEHVLQFA